MSNPRAPLNSARLPATVGQFMGAYRNKIINGDFDVWQRGTSFPGSGYTSDRWAIITGSNTFVCTQQSHTVGLSTPPGSPRYFLRNVVTSVANSAAYNVLIQSIEGVRSLSGKTATITFYAKADASKNIALELVQTFGTGGSPSSTVTGIGTQLVALTTSWQKFSIAVAIPSISGKTLGSNNDDNLSLNFWFNAGSTFNARTASLGQQSGTFDISHVSVVEGDATKEDDPFSPRHIQQELDLCYRYYQKSYDLATALGANTNTVGGNIALSLNCKPLIGKQSTSGQRSGSSEPFPVTMRATPSVTYWDLGGNATRVTTGDANSASLLHNDNTDSFRSFTATTTAIKGHAGPTSSLYWGVNWDASAEL